MAGFENKIDLGDIVRLEYMSSVGADTFEIVGYIIGKTANGVKISNYNPSKVPKALSNRVSEFYNYSHIVACTTLARVSLENLFAKAL